MKNESVPDEKSLREKFLRDIREAKTLSDLKRIKWSQPMAAKWLSRCEYPKDLNDDNRWLFILLAAQAKELRNQRDYLARRVELLSSYHSPLWGEVRHEPCPIREFELRCKAEQDDARMDEQRRQELAAPFNRLMDAMVKAQPSEWKSRDASLPHRSFRAVLWHEPMSAMDYHEAIGLSRRTIKDMLDRLRAQPIAPRERPNKSARYARNTNHAILCDWLKRRVKDPQKRRGWLARTLLYCQHETPALFAELNKSVRPVLESLGEPPQEFERYLKKCKAILYPPQQSTVPTDKAFLTDLDILSPPSQ
jgi:hypothetical protein